MIAIVTTAHPRRDIRIFYKEATSLAGEFENVVLVVADGAGPDASGTVPIFDIGRPFTGRVARILLQPWRMFWFLLRLRPRIIHFHDPEFLPVALVLVHLRFTVVYDVHEDVPRQILSKHWIAKSLRLALAGCIGRLEEFVARRISGVVAATPHIACRFTQTNQRTVEVKNYPILSEFSTPARSKRPEKRICYVGAISRTRGIQPIIEAMPLLPSFRFTLCGSFAESDLEDELRCMPGWKQVDYLGTVDRPTVRRVLDESVAGVVTLLPTESYVNSLPIKMFEYMAAELPVVASNFPLWKQIIADSSAGLCVNPCSPQSIAAAIEQLSASPDLARAMGKAGRDAVLREYNWDVEAAKLIKFYRELR